MLWVITAVLMVRDYVADPYNPSLQGTDAYGHNSEGSLLPALGITVIELAVVYLILRPWSYRRSWLRAGIAFVIYLPWTGLSGFMCMHAGGIFAIHFLWLASLGMTLAICFVWSGLAAIQARPATPTTFPQAR